MRLLSPLLSIGFVSVLSFPLAAGAAPSVLAGWTFEAVTGLPVNVTNYGPLASDVGSGDLTSYHRNGGGFSAPVGNGSSLSLSSSAWVLDDYYQFKTSSKGYQDLVLKWDHTSSASGPADFSLRYSLDGIAYSDINSYKVSNITWSSTSTSAASSRIVNLSAIPNLNDQSSVYLRLQMNGTSRADGQTGSVSFTNGTSRIDNVFIEAEKITTSAVPGPLPALGVVAAFGTARRLRRRVRLMAPSA